MVFLAVDELVRALLVLAVLVEVLDALTDVESESLRVLEDEELGATELEVVEVTDA